MLNQDIKPGDLCLAFDPQLTGQQECIAVNFIPKNTCVKTPYGLELIAKYDLWLVDRNLQWKREYFPKDYVDSSYLIKISGGEELEKIEKSKPIKVTS